MKDLRKPLTEIILDSQGVDVSIYEETFLDKSIQKRINETSCDSEESYYSFVEKNLHEGEKLLSSLQISYSEFFRNPLTFSVLERIIMPSLIKNLTNCRRKEIRIWSAACAAGQETYSLAMLLNDFKNSDGEKIKFRIFATDQSVVQVNEAKEGLYSENAVTNLNMKRLNQWFVKTGDSYQVKDELKENIEFSVFDLFDENYSCPPSSIFGDFDLVLCANLLFYYKPQFRGRIIEKTTRCLTPGGYLITGETERETIMNYNFMEVFPQSAIFRKKHLM